MQLSASLFPLLHSKPGDERHVWNLLRVNKPGSGRDRAEVCVILSMPCGPGGQCGTGAGSVDSFFFFPFLYLPQLETYSPSSPALELSLASSGL